MRCLRKLVSLLILTKFTEAAPRVVDTGGVWQAPEATDTITTITSTKESTLTQTVTSTSTSRRLPDCSKGGECDCSVIEDKSSPEWFQCVTNAFCEVCWVTTLTKTPSPTPTPTPSASTDYQTMPVGTYTVTMSDGTVQVIVVTPPPAITTMTITATFQAVAGIGAAPPAYGSLTKVVSSSTSAAWDFTEDCVEFCKCDQFEDKKSEDYLNCVDSLACAVCPSPIPSPYASPTVSAASASTTCPDPCDCSKMKDRKKDDYCVVNLFCESCGDEVGGGE